MGNEKIYLDGLVVKPGDKLWSTVAGWITVHMILPGAQYPITCLNGESSYDATGRYFNNGRDRPRCLFWNEVKIVPPAPPAQTVTRWHWLMQQPNGDYWVTGHRYTQKEAQTQFARDPSCIVCNIEESRREEPA